MKTYVLSGASALALMIAVPALAQDNTSDVAQSGSGNAATVTQSGVREVPP